MTEDPRCCGTGTCIIDAAGRCWCGQQWNGTTMCFTQADPPADAPTSEPPAPRDTISRTPD